MPAPNAPVRWLSRRTAFGSLVVAVGGWLRGEHGVRQLDQPSPGEEAAVEDGEGKPPQGVKLEDRAGKLLGPFNGNFLPVAGGEEERFRLGGCDQLVITLAPQR